MDTVHYTSRYYKIMGDAQDAHFIHAKDGAMCVPLTDEGDVIFIVEHSPAFDMPVLYLPAGAIDPGESTDITANRELQEEIGYKAGRLDLLARVRPWIKYLQVEIALYLARDLTESKLEGDEDILRLERHPLKDFEHLIESGRLHDATVIAALYLARRYA